MKHTKLYREGAAIFATDGMYSGKIADLTDIVNGRLMAAEIVQMAEQHERLVVALKLARGYAETLHQSISKATGNGSVVEKDLATIDAALDACEVG